MIVSVHQPQYLPWLGYFDKISRSDVFVFLDCVEYKHREFQNRNRIRTKDGPVWLTVPVRFSGSERPLTRDILIDNNLPWRRQHRKSLEFWYRKAPFFGEYFPFFEDVYSRDWQKLIDLNLEITGYVLTKLAIKTKLVFESALDTGARKTDRIVEICRKLKADVYLSGAGGRDYLEAEKFPTAGVELTYQDFAHPVYRQQFMAADTDFLPYMSVADLLFNEGPKSREILGLKNEGRER